MMANAISQARTRVRRMAVCEAFFDRGVVAAAAAALRA